MVEKKILLVTTITGIILIVTVLISGCIDKTIADTEYYKIESKGTDKSLINSYYVYNATFELKAKKNMGEVDIDYETSDPHNVTINLDAKGLDGENTDSLLKNESIYIRAIIKSPYRSTEWFRLVIEFFDIDNVRHNAPTEKYYISPEEGIPGFSLILCIVSISIITLIIILTKKRKSNNI